MKSTRFSENPFMKVLKKHAAGRVTKDLCQEFGIFRSTFFNLQRLFSACSILLFIFCFANCSQKKKMEIPGGNPEQITINDKQNEKGLLSTFIDSTQYIILETKPECIIGRIDKITIQHDKIYILQNGKSQILVFDTSGKYLFGIDSKGKGPGEYISIIDFDIDKKSNEILICQSRNLMIFSENGKYVKSYDFPFSAYNMHKMDHYYFYSLGFDLPNDKKFNLYEIDPKTFTLIQATFPTCVNTDQYIMSNNNAFFSHHDELWFHYGINDTIYSIGKSKYRPVYSVHFGHNTTIEQIARIDNTHERISMMNSPDFLHGFSNLLFNERFIWFEYGYQGNDHFVLYDRKNKKAKDLLDLNNDFDEISVKSPFHMDDHSLFFIVQPYSFFEDADSLPEKVKTKIGDMNLKIDDNPLILKAYLK